MNATMYGLRIALGITDRQRAVFITGSARVRGYKFFPGHFRHRGKNALVIDTARHQLPLDHSLTLGRKLRRRRRLLAATARCQNRYGQPLPNSLHSTT